ncbi:MAG: hypothetical protein M1820_007440 [Bogoriella megaspora]|nr:MAG: hypothetical protein M1820_007440 [Bogoriella megaspora]
MPISKPNKARLYLAVYTSFNSSNVEYAFIVAPKSESLDPRVLDATKYHCRQNASRNDDSFSSSSTAQSSQPWLFEQLALNASTDPDLLVRICISKLDNLQAFEQSLQKVPVSQGDPDFTPEWWLQMAWSQLQYEQMLSKESTWSWGTILGTANRYLQEKKHLGRLSTSKSRGMQPAPVYDMMTKKEIIV